MPGRSEVPQFDVTPAAVQIRAHEAAEQTAKREHVFEYLPQAVRKFVDWYGNWEEARAAWQKQFPQSFNFAQRIPVSGVLGHFFITLADFEGVIENTDFALDRNYDQEMDDNDPYATTYEITILETATVEYLFAELEEASTPIWEAHREYTPKPGASQYDQQTKPQDDAEQLSETAAVETQTRGEVATTRETEKDPAEQKAPAATEVLTLTNRDKESVSRELDIFVRQVVNGIIFVKQATGVYSRRTLAIEPNQLFYRWLKARAQHETLTPVLNIRMEGTDLYVSAKKGSTPESVATALVAVCAAEDITVPASLTQFLPKELQDTAPEAVVAETTLIQEQSEEVAVFDSGQEESESKKREEIPVHLQRLVSTTILYTYRKLFSELTLMGDYTITANHRHDPEEFFDLIQQVAAIAEKDHRVKPYLQAWEVSVTDSEARLSLKPTHRGDKNAEYKAFSSLGAVLEYLEQ